MELAQPIAAPAGAPPAWSLPRRIGFRLLCSFFVLLVEPFPLDRVPGVRKLADVNQHAWDVIVVFVGQHVFHAGAVNTAFNGSGDRAYDWILLATLIALAALATAVWSIVDRRRPDYRRLDAWLRVGLRYWLGTVMIGYGAVKVVKLQFPDLSPIRLMEPYGDSSPMGLLWSFMGYSKSYTFFAGAGEVLGGVLLFWRRTTTLGALVTAAVMTNVVMLNFSYDVPVKIFSSELLATALFLAAPDLPRLASVLVGNRAAPPAAQAPLVPPGKWCWAARGLKAAFLVTLAVTTAMEVRGDGRLHASPLDGAYEVEAFVRDGQVVPPSLTEAKRWRKVGLIAAYRLQVRYMDDSPERFNLVHDEAQHRFTLSRGQGDKDVVTYAQPDAEHLELDGRVLGQALHVRLRKLPASGWLLTSRGFHWVNEVPFNR